MAAPRFPALLLARPVQRLAAAPSLRRCIADNSSPPDGGASRRDTDSAIANLFGSSNSAESPAGNPTRRRNDQAFGAAFSTPPSRAPRRPPGLKFEDMTMPDGMAGSSMSPRQQNAAAALAAQQESTFESYPHLNPTYGRTVDLDPSRGRDIVRGIGMLGSLMARNRVKSDFAKQRFHERPGLKRKRLNSERWRARFKTGFRHVTARVTELTKKGW